MEVSRFCTNCFDMVTDLPRRSDLDKRGRNEESKAKRQADREAGRTTVLPEGFAQEEIDAEDRKPKRKVAIMIGYSGTGYKGMQM